MTVSRPLLYKNQITGKMLLAELFPYAGLVYNIIMVLYVVMVLAVIGVVLGENRNPVKSIAWVLVLVLHSPKWVLV